MLGNRGSDFVFRPRLGDSYPLAFVLQSSKIDIFLCGSGSGSTTLLLIKDAPDIRPDNPAFLISGIP
jgi:hypothetical protein